MRACQTFNHVLKEKGVKTDPPQMEKLSMETTQWQIFDAYMKEYMSRMEKEAEEQKQRNVKEKRSNQQPTTVKEDPLYSASMKRCLKIMERMIV
jgi:dynein intermediate chain 1, axonemal